MSLVNKVIRDLEERQAMTLKDETRIFRGLSPADRNNPRRGILTLNTFIILLFLVISVSATYAIMDRAADQAIMKIDKRVKNAPTLNAAGTRQTISALTGPAGNNASSMVPAGEESGIIDSGPQLRLDLSLSSPDKHRTIAKDSENPGVPQSTLASSLNSIQLDSAEGGLRLRLDLSGLADYRAYALADPDRVVVEIDDTEFNGKLPEIAAIPAIRNIRIRREAGGKLILVLDAHGPLTIDDIDRLNDRQGMGLVLSLTSEPQEQSDIYAQLSELPREGSAGNRITTSHFGEININPKRGGRHDRFESMYQDAQEFYRSNKMIEGNELLAILLREKPEHVDARTLLVKKLINQGQLQRAEKLLKDVVNSSLWNPQWADLYARLMVNRGDNITAVKILSGMKPELEANPDYYAFLAALYQKNEQHENAVFTYRKILQIKPGNGVWWMGLAISLEALGRNGDALFAYNRSLKGKRMTQDLQKYVQGKISYLRKRS